MLLIHFLTMPLEIFHFVIWVIFWVIPFGLGIIFAKNKGRSAWYGAALPFFLSWLGFLVVLISPESTEVRVRREHEERVRLRLMMQDDGKEQQ